MIFQEPLVRDSPWSMRECGRGHVVEATVLLLTTWLSTSLLMLPGRRWRQQLSLLSTPCIPLLPALVDCQMPHDDTVVVIFVVIASVISHLVLASALTPLAWMYSGEFFQNKPIKYYGFMSIVL